MRRAAIVFLALASAAHADGAFPDSFALFAPADQSDAFRLATNFGLVVSSDGAQSWHYVCENAIIAFASLYSQGPDDALYAVSTLGLVSSRDGGCSWTAAGGALALASVSDAFADPSDAQHVLAIARVVGDGGTAEDAAIYQSRDGAMTFGDTPLYRPPAGASLTGIEIARSDPKVIYATMYQSGPHAYLARSTDGGASFSVVDLGDGRFPRLIAVDPANPQRIFLRLGTRDGDLLGVSEDGGTTVQTPLLTGTMTAFLLRQNGTILVGGNAPAAWRSSDGGKTFATWSIGLHLRGLAERGGTLYAVGDDVLDDGAVFASTDESTFTPLLQFRDILGPAECGQVATTCAIPWAQLQPLINPGFEGNVPADLAMADAHDGGGCGFVPGALGLMPLLFIVLLVCVRYLPSRRRCGTQKR